MSVETFNYDPTSPHSLTSQITSHVQAFKSYLSLSRLPNSAPDSPTYFGGEVFSKCQLEKVEILGLPDGFEEEWKKERLRERESGGKIGQKKEENRVWKGAEVRTTYKLKVVECMCNFHGVMHGGCQTFLLDVCTSLAIIALSHPESTRWSRSGVTADIQLRCLNAIPLGTTVKIVCTTLSQGSRMAAVDFRIQDYDPPVSPPPPDWVPKLYAQGSQAKIEISFSKKPSKL